MQAVIGLAVVFSTELTGIRLDTVGFEGQTFCGRREGLILFFL